MNYFKIIGIIIIGIFFFGFQESAVTKPINRPPLVLLYDVLPDLNAITRVQSISAKQFFILYQGCDPQSFKSGVIDIPAVLMAIQKQTGGQLPEWCMLDFEDPFNADLQKSPTAPECKRALNSMIETIKAVKKIYPNTKWSYYGVPWLPYWMQGKGWASANNETKKTTLDQAVQVYTSLVNELDWISPTIYPKYDPMLFPSDQSKTVVEEGRAWRMAQVGLAKFLSSGKPIIPTICPYWTPGGKAPFCQVVPSKSVIDDQVAPAISMGASGIAVWTSINYFIQQAINGPTKSSPGETDFGSNEWRKAFTTDYFNNKPPTDWSDPQVKQDLIQKVSKTITDTLFNIRSWERFQSISN